MKYVLLAILAAAVAATLISLLPAGASAAQATPSSRANAVRSAQGYVRAMPFSLKSLIHHLEYEGYSTSDATCGASHSGANWSKETVESAKGDLRRMPFSRSGLIHQLEYEGFTHSQALHGLRATGL